MSKSHETLVDAQFSPQAQAYVDSPVHSRGEDLDRIEQLAQQAMPMTALDLGTGGGTCLRRSRRRPSRGV
jgi:hypothetical protein